MNSETPRREARSSLQDVVVDRREDGSILVRCAHPLGSYAERMTDRLDHWARHASYRTFLAQRDARGQWRNITYAETQYFARRIGQALLNRGLSVERPVLILSGNDIEHALLGIGAMYAGIPYVPVSPEYSLASDNFEALRHIFELMTPGLVFGSDRRKFERALSAVMPKDAELMVNEDSSPGATDFSELVNTEPEGLIEATSAHLHANTIFKILFSDDSTGNPKGVIYTHRMWSSSQEMLRHCFPFLATEPPVLVDGLPWSNAAGGNSSVGLALYNGGSLYLDNGNASEFEATVRNLRAISPTLYCATPSVFDTLLPSLRDEKFRKHFFGRLKLLCCYGDELSPQVWNGLLEQMGEERVEDVPLLTGLAASENGLLKLRSRELPGSVGFLPAPGVEVKLVPAANDRFQVRLRGPNITLGYWRQLDRTRASFDEEGYLRVEEPVEFVDPADLSRGFRRASAP